MEHRSLHLRAIHFELVKPLWCTDLGLGLRELTKTYRNDQQSHSAHLYQIWGLQKTKLRMEQQIQNSSLPATQRHRSLLDRPPKPRIRRLSSTLMENRSQSHHRTQVYLQWDRWWGMSVPNQSSSMPMVFQIFRRRLRRTSHLRNRAQRCLRVPV